jgi:membrane protease subunit HflK
MNKNISFDLEHIKRPTIPWKTFSWIVLIVLIVIIVYSSIFTIDPEEVGIVLQFGKYSHTAGPGLNFKIPFGIEVVKKVPVRRQLKLEFGFRTAQPDVRTIYESKDFREESLMLTGDLNAAEVEWIVQYRIKALLSIFLR